MLVLLIYSIVYTYSRSLLFTKLQRRFHAIKEQGLDKKVRQSPLIPSYFLNVPMCLPNASVFDQFPHSLPD